MYLISRIVLAVGAFLAMPAAADPRFVLAEVITHTNDFFVDGQDRWRTGSLSASILHGPEFAGQAPSKFGALLEIRTRIEMITPADLSQPNPGADRPYVGAISLGVFSHQRRQNLDITAGAELVIIGPSTGVSQIQSWLHARLDPINPILLAGQLADAVHPTLSLEVGQTLQLSSLANLRPFAEVQAGVETFARAGIDLTFSTQPPQDLRLREVVTGQRIPALHMWGTRSWGLGLGGDITYVANSQYLGGSNGPQPMPIRTRLRAGAFYQGDKLDAFYGVSWLSPEFSDQSEGQSVAALSVSLRF